MKNDLIISHDLERLRFFVMVNGKECLMDYSDDGNGVLNFYHTFVPKDLRGQGIADKIVAAAADYAVKKGYKILPTCAFAVVFFKRHKQYSDWVVHS